MPSFRLHCISRGRHLLTGLILCTPLVFVGPSVAVATDIEGTANTLFKSFTKTNAVETELDVDSELAIEVQNFYIALLRPTWGMDVGYAALATQSAHEGQSPPTGILLENMFTGTRATISRSLGIDMQAAAELYFRVKSADLNFAVNREEVLRSLHSVIPGVRLSDTLVSEHVPHDRSVLSAANLEVRMCVLGGPLDLDSDLDWIERLSSFDIAMFDQDKQQIATKGASMSVHPLDAVLATRDALVARGIQVVEGDILAIGTLTDHIGVGELSRLRVEFEGLSDEQPVFVYMAFR